MKEIAGFFNKVLRQITKSDIMENYAELRKKFGDRAVLRALHFMDCNKRVDMECEALKNGDFDKFLNIVNQSGDSSYKYLQNIFASSSPQEQGLSSALYIAKDILQGQGACRVHGGGFAGTIQAFVPNESLKNSKQKLKLFLARGPAVLDIRPVGGTEVEFLMQIHKG